MKYRKQIYQEEIDTELKEYIRNMSEEYDFTILAEEVLPSRIHLRLDR